LLGALRNVGGGEQGAVVDGARLGRGRRILSRHFDVVARELVFLVLEHRVGGLVEADQGEARAEDAEGDLVEAEITHGVALFQSLERPQRSSIRARAREAFLHFSAGAATGISPAK
jgi:hypothetical protein